MVIPRGLPDYELRQVPRLRQLFAAGNQISKIDEAEPEGLGACFNTFRCPDVSPPNPSGLKDADCLISRCYKMETFNSAQRPSDSNLFAPS